MQLGPMTRMPAETARLTAERSALARSGSPVSEKPAVKRWSVRTPFSAHCSTSPGTAEAGTCEMTWSTGPGQSRSEA